MIDNKLLPFIDEIKIDVGEQIKFTILSVISPDGHRTATPWIKENLSPWSKTPLWNIPKPEVSLCDQLNISEQTGETLTMI